MTFYGMITGYLDTEVKDEINELAKKSEKKIKKQA